MSFGTLSTVRLHIFSFFSLETALPRVEIGNFAITIIKQKNLGHFYNHKDPFPGPKNYNDPH